jgi:YD repeat-containing protein
MRRRFACVLLACLLGACSRSGKEHSLRYRYRYDKQDRLVEAVAPDGASTRYYYDRQGRLVSVRYAKGGVDYGYGDEGLLWTKDSEGSTEFFRDNLGRVADMVWRRNGDKVVHLALDPWGGLTGVSVYRLTPAPAALADTAKVLLGRLTSAGDAREKRRQALQRLLAAGDSSPEYSVRYERDIYGRLTGMDSKAGRVTFAYRDDIRETERRLPNGIRTVLRYTPEGQVQSLAHYEPAGRLIGSWNYVYDSAGLLVKTDEVVAGQTSASELRRDPKGILREVAARGKADELWQYDEYGRPIREGNAALEWNRAGQLAARTAGGLRVKFEYDGRDLPLRASASGTDYRFRWDTEGRLDSYSTPEGKFVLLPDLTGTTAEPWMKWQVGTSAPISYYSDGAVYAAVDARGDVRYLLRDGQGKVRFTADRDGRLQAAGKASNAQLKIQPAAFDPSSSLSQIQNQWTDAVSEMALEIERIMQEQKPKLQDPELRGLLFNTKVQNYVSDFLKSTPQTQINLDLRGISNDWQDAFGETGKEYPKKDGLVIPMFGSIPKSTDLLGTFWEKAAAALPIVGDVMQTRKIDLPAILEQARAAGKAINSIACESGCGFDLQHQIDPLLHFAQEHPNDKMPAIILVSTSIGADNVERLREARFPVVERGTDPLVPMLVDPGPLANVWVVGKALSIPLQVADAAWMGLSTMARGQPLPSLVAGHGTEALRPQIQQLQATDWLSDPTAKSRAQLGGIELGAKATAVGHIGAIRGVVYDKASQRVALLGDKTITAQGLDAEDFAVALLLAYHDPPITPQFSLDPADPRKPDGKWLKAVYLPQEMLAGTAMGQTMFITDWLMKQYSFGMSVDSDGHVAQLPVLPGGLVDQFTISFRNTHRREKTSWTRLWIVADDFKIQVHGNALTFQTAKMGVRAKRQVVDPSSPTGLRDDESAVEESAREFATRFTANYDKVAEESPEFYRLRELAKTMALANWLRDSGVPVDLEWARQTAGRRSPYVDKVPTLTNTRETDTESIRLRGGVDLTVSAVKMAEAPLAEEISTIAMAPLESEPAFVLKAGGEELEGSVLPVTRSGREAWSKAGTQMLGDVTRTVDAAGRAARLEYPSGESVIYSYGKQGELAAAKVAEPTGWEDTYQFGPGGKITGGELRGEVKMTTMRDADGSLKGMRFTSPSGDRAQAVFGKSAGPTVPPGGSLVDVSRGGRMFHLRYDARGNLVSFNAGGTHVASYAVEGKTVTAWAGEYSESVTATPDGAAQIIRRTAPDLDGKLVTQTVEIPARPAGRLFSTPAPEGRLNLPSGSTISVEAESGGGGSTLEISQRPITEDLVVGKNAATVDAQGRILNERSQVIGQLGTDAAPSHAIVMDSPKAVVEMQTKYGAKTEFYLGKDAKLAQTNLQRMEGLSKAGDVTVQVPGRQSGVTDFDAIQSIRDAIPDMKIVEEDMQTVTSKVDILTAHNSPEMRQWVEKLGARGAFRGKVIMLNSCHGAMDPEWTSMLIRNYDAVGVYSYTEPIAPQAVKDVMIEFHELLNAPRSYPESLITIWRRAVGEAAEKAPTDWLRRQILLLGKGVMQLSRLTSGPDQDGDRG